MMKAIVTKQATGSTPFVRREVHFQIRDEHIPTQAQHDKGERFEVEFKETDSDDDLILTVRRVGKEENRGKMKYMISAGNRDMIVGDIRGVRDVVRQIETSTAAYNPLAVWLTMVAIDAGLDLKTFAEVYDR